MKAKLILSTIFLVASISLYAQDSSKLTKVFLQDGTTFSAYVESQGDGGYKLTTEDGTIFYFREGEISLNKPFKKSTKDSRAKAPVQRQENSQTTNQAQLPKTPVQSFKYRDLKKMYSARDYYGHELGDKYSPAAIGIASFIVPGLGQYITGSQIGWGIFQSFLFGIAAPNVFVFNIRTYEEFHYDNRGNKITDVYFETGEWVKEVGIPMMGIWIGTAIWSACSASKAAKIKNLYYRDLRNGVTYQFDVAPYFDVTTPVLASNQNFVTGLSFKVSF